MEVGSQGQALQVAGDAECEWRVGKLPPDVVPNLSVVSEEPLKVAVVCVKFRCPGVALSGATVCEMKVENESYRVFKGVRAVTEATNIDFRV